MAKVYVDDVKELIQKAGFIRSKLAEATRHIGNVHIGGPISATYVAVALYYKHLGFELLHLDDPECDMFILSKGHNGILLYIIYVTLAFTILIIFGVPTTRLKVLLALILIECA